MFADAVHSLVQFLQPLRDFLTAVGIAGEVANLLRLLQHVVRGGVGIIEVVAVAEAAMQRQAQPIGEHGHVGRHLRHAGISSELWSCCRSLRLRSERLGLWDRLGQRAVIGGRRWIGQCVVGECGPSSHDCLLIFVSDTGIDHQVMQRTADLIDLSLEGVDVIGGRAARLIHPAADFGIDAVHVLVDLRQPPSDLRSIARIAAQVAHRLSLLQHAVSGSIRPVEARSILKPLVHRQAH